MNKPEPVKNKKKEKTFTCVIEMLDSEVMAVAVVDTSKRWWYAVIGAVDEVAIKEHEKEAMIEVTETGTKLSFGIGKNIFPAIAERNKWRG